MSSFRRLMLAGVALLFFAPDLWALQRSLGSPYIRNISPEEYEGRVQNWHAAQASSGIMYIANLGGVLEYDGEQWHTINLPNTTALSVGIYNDTVFVGGVNEIGYLYSPSGDSAHIQYRSLKSKIQENYSDFGDVWQAIPTQKGIFFRSGKYLFRYKNGSFDYWKSETGFHFAFNVREELYINVRQKGLHKVVGNQLQLIPNGEVFAEDGIYAMLPHEKGSILMATRFKNLVIYDGGEVRNFESKANAFLEDHRLYNGIKLRDGSIVLGTTQGGIVRIDSQGKILDVINKEMGMLTDVVYHLFEDREGNLWVSQNEGLSVINILSPVKTYDERYGLEGMPRSMYADDEQFFIGTNKGLYQLQEADYESLFKRVDGYTDLPNDFIQFDNQLLFTSSEGIYEIGNGKVNQLLKNRYSTCITPSSQYPGYFYVCGRDGLYIIQKKEGSFTKLGKINGITSEVNSVEEDSNGNVWVGVYTKGIYQLQWSEEKQSLLKPHLLLRASHKKRPRVFKIGDEILFGFNQSTMRYDAELDSLVENISLETELFQDTNPGIFLMAEDKNENLWLRSAEFNIQAVRQGNSVFKEQPSNLNLIKSHQFNFIYPAEEGIVWFGTEEGLIRYDPSLSYEYKVNYQSFIRKVKIHNDSLIYSGPRENPKNYTFSYAENELRFEYAAPTFVRNDDVEYQIFLEGFDNKWSDWTTETRKDYTNIPEGNYTFKVRARNIHHKISRAGLFEFIILPPWYRTWWAYGLYVVMIGGLLYGAHQMRINRILREQRIRNRIASDLHDEVSATLSSITYFAQAIRQRRKGEPSKRFIDLISESATEAKEKITDIIWSIDPENDDWVNLLSKCRRFASDLLESKNINYQLDIDTDIDRPLDIELRQHLWLIFKEMVVNTARHSEAGKVEVTFGMRGNTLKLIVQDDGVGITDNFDRSPGNGIKNIKKRARQIGAKLRLKTDPEVGTRWFMLLKMN